MDAKGLTSQQMVVGGYINLLAQSTADIEKALTVKMKNNQAAKVKSLLVKMNNDQAVKV